MTIDDLDTPFLIADLNIVERNIARNQAYFDQHGIRNRPHIKTHKLPLLAWKQMHAGAVGITCQKVTEAEVMAQSGLPDIFISYNVVGKHKIDLIGGLATQCTLSMAADSEYTLRGYSEAASRFGATIHAVIEVDTGGGRAGVTTVGEATSLARLAADLPGLTFHGFMTYPTGPNTGPMFQEILQDLERYGLKPQVISGGGSPLQWDAHQTPICNEHRSGTNLYVDRNLVNAGTYTWDDCALRVVTTVVSRPTRERCILDAGSKAMTNDPDKQGGFHYCPEYPELRVVKHSEEHGHVDLSACERIPSVGERVTLIPNHACATVNMHDLIALHRGGKVEAIVPILARGKIR